MARSPTVMSGFFSWAEALLSVRLIANVLNDYNGLRKRRIVSVEKIRLFSNSLLSSFVKRQIPLLNHA